MSPSGPVKEEVLALGPYLSTEKGPHAKLGFTAFNDISVLYMEEAQPKRLGFSYNSYPNYY